MAEKKEKLKGKDGASYIRQQKGHSVLFHIFFGWMALWIPAIYFTVSKDHYWHL